MGLLVVGTPLPWDEALPWLQYVREHGVAQFLHTYHRVKDLSEDVLKWGDELEYGIFQIDSSKKKVQLSLRGADILCLLKEKEEKYGRDDNFKEACQWHPEYGAWMVEATPKIPYGGYASDLLRVECNMRLRRARLLAVLKDNEIAPTVTCFPLLGALKSSSTKGPIAESSYVGDEVINPHPRFGTLTANIRKRRGSKVDIRVPIFRDVHTCSPMVKRSRSSNKTWMAEHSRKKIKLSVLNGKGTGLTPSLNKLDSNVSNSSTDSDSTPITEPYPGFIHMDCMAFGMGMCCLQVTFQAKNICESRHLYDHLGVLSPILLALTAATPILKGKLADTDVRWATIAAAVDDRTPMERDIPETTNDESKYEHYAGKGKRRLPKSRYEGISTYICNHKQGNDPSCSLDMYNDLPFPYDEETYEKLKADGVDDPLSKHIAHLFIRDPLVIYNERIQIDDTNETDHFENIQSTNWQTVRWKPPPPKKSPSDCHVGWRTEFRSMEVQLTDFENAAFTVFIVLVSRVILAFELNLYIPISKVEENMEIAHRRNAAVKEKFYFRSHLAPPEQTDCSIGKNEKECQIHSDPNRYEPMSIAEILLGKGDYFTGLIPLVYAYLEHIECDDATKEVISRYMKLIEKRATGELPTAATWMRDFVRKHPSYNQDSIVNEDIAYDLLLECRQIGEGKKDCPELLGDIKIDPIESHGAYEVPLTSNEVDSAKRLHLLQRYTSRAGNNEHK